MTRTGAEGGAPSIQRCAIHLVDGRHLTNGSAVLIERGHRIEVRVTELSAPGALLNQLLGRGVRGYRIALYDGRVLPAELTSTTWAASGRRLCTFVLS